MCFFFLIYSHFNFCITEKEKILKRNRNHLVLLHKNNKNENNKRDREKEKKGYFILLFKL